MGFRWWKDLGLGEQLSFTRDRLVECFFWAAAMTPKPQFGRCQEAVAKVAQLIIIIDDIYDVYGTVDELELFTNAVDRSVTTFLTTIHRRILHFILNSWGQRRIKEVKKDELKRGDVPKSIQCYMHEARVTEDVARNHIMGLFRETWKKLNEYLVESSLPHAFIDHAMSLGRVSYCTYKHGDGFSVDLEILAVKRKRCSCLYLRNPFKLMKPRVFHFMLMVDLPD
ncbi:Geraniol synthase, chloroplastic [Cinnamomum micranthum f. kanehirae]|uniref:Geraniol synthase, chloroplastic n=1 Tax=Cinnamomum micranthum f. kanehirae TaxID=337451 RepID=A0A3S3N6Y3_9MAGN|nr:Geraniol synthase, chloroplastic [Cinnamomum micranthum f. kanehirae]